MKRLSLAVLVLFVVTAAACDAAGITGSPPPASNAADGPTMGSGV